MYVLEIIPGVHSLSTRGRLGASLPIHFVNFTNSNCLGRVMPVYEVSHLRSATVRKLDFVSIRYLREGIIPNLHK